MAYYQRYDLPFWISSFQCCAPIVISIFRFLWCLFTDPLLRMIHFPVQSVTLPYYDEAEACLFVLRLGLHSCAIRGSTEFHCSSCLKLLEYGIKADVTAKTQNWRKLCYDKTLEFLREGKTLKAQPSLETRQKEYYAPRLTRRGNREVRHIFLLFWVFTLLKCYAWCRSHIVAFLSGNWWGAWCSGTITTSSWTLVACLHLHALLPYLQIRYKAVLCCIT